MELTINFIARKLQDSYGNVIAYNDLQKSFSSCRILICIHFILSIL